MKRLPKESRDRRKQVELPILLPGIRMSPTDYLPIEQMQLMRFDGVHWVRFGNVLSKR